jgi:hypothetical protein
VKHVPGLRTNLISLGILHEEGRLYQAAPDKKTLRVMHGGKMIMVGEKSCAQQYKLKGSVVGGGVMDGNASTRCSIRWSARWQRPRQAVLSEQQRRQLKCGTWRFVHGQAQGGVYIRQGGYC